MLIAGDAWAGSRAHAVTNAREGTSVVIVDVGPQVDGLTYPTASGEDFRGDDLACRGV